MGRGPSGSAADAGGQNLLRAGFPREADRELRRWAVVLAVIGDGDPPVSAATKRVLEERSLRTWPMNAWFPGRRVAWQWLSNWSTSADVSDPGNGFFFEVHQVGHYSGGVGRRLAMKLQGDMR